MKKEKKAFWASILNSIPLPVRRRASSYLSRIRQESENEWVVWSKNGTTYSVRATNNRVTCTCAYYQDRKESCKHIAAVCAQELFELSGSE